MVNQIKIRNPRTGINDYFITQPTVEQIATKCLNLRPAQIEWEKSGIEKRIQAMQQWKETIFSHREKLTQALVNDTGRLIESRLEIDSVANSIDRWCKLAPQLLSTESTKTTTIPFIQLQNQFSPYPLVGIISPWNFPLLLSLIDAIPALIAGCAVAIKPSEITPRFIQPLLETIAKIPLLCDVFTYIEGTGETGAALIEYVDFICFTGSVATGKKVAEAAAKRFIPACLELGGKDPAIVLASADLELATSALLWASVVNAGQSCLSIERIYVAESILTEFITKLTEKAKGLKLAYPNVESGEIGPIISIKQAEIIREHLQDAVTKGAVIHCGGNVENLDGGFWCLPTVLDRVNHSMKIMTEETFGPIIPVMSFTTIEEAVKLANDTIYGLSAAVFAGSEAEALAVASQINAGGISINDAGLTALINEGEKNSFKFSGLGTSRMGVDGMKRFMRKKAILSKVNSVINPWWFKS
ncbi:MAG: aldehyde dehydrogenase family protein [Okeania sp. SIO2C9]|uniref:aldehyde dehydrogenase family protein n=1 Tax=Okeania sp. SIO2C9 TaxID=2607791 RepID=UPI0013BF069B|nr:aldehyde dehydrogenase family protein [Okeania sp. SIO2C9]NEQ77798.1 aldehyde dehydrogenase family protein [Okeania sp. SIO2C9]